MTKASWQSVRILLLGAMLGGTLFVIGKAVTFYTASSSSRDAITSSQALPAAVSLKNWQFLRRIDLPPKPGLPIGRQYQYRQKATVLTVQMQYVLGDGDIGRFLFMFTPLQASSRALEVRHQPGVGFYGVMSHEGQAYLSACINPRGETTVTEPQFTKNRYTYDLTAYRLLLWIKGQEPLLDRRCLWTLMSIPLSEKNSDAAVERAFKMLEAVWFSWYPVWQKNFLPSQQ